MDTGKGHFETLDDEVGEDRIPAEIDAMKAALEAKYPKHGGWFREGEIIEIRGSRFRIKSVKPKELRLKLLKRAE